MRIKRTVVLAASAALATALALGACGASTTTQPAASNVEVSDAVFNPGDITFAQGMIPHHEQAVEMATIALDPTRKASPAVIGLATRIKGAQAPEISLMASWLTAWNQPVMAGMNPGESMPPGATMPGMEGMDGMMSATEMEDLGKVSGSDFDKMWLTMMIRHHEGAVTMSRDVSAEGKNDEVKTLAGKIVEAQTAEIDEMNKLLKQ